MQTVKIVILLRAGLNNSQHLICLPVSQTGPGAFGEQTWLLGIEY